MRCGLPVALVPCVGVHNTRTRLLAGSSGTQTVTRKIQSSFKDLHGDFASSSIKLGVCCKVGPVYLFYFPQHYRIGVI